MSEDTLVREGPGSKISESTKDVPGLDIKELQNEDVSKLLESSQILLKQFIEDYPNELPTAVLLPDTSARPLKYLLDPVVDKIARKRGVQKPAFFFVKTKRITYLSSIEWTMEIPPGEGSEEVEKSLLRAKIRRDIGAAEREKIVREEQMDRKKMRERAEEIKSSLKKKGEKPSFVIFDDYKIDGGTISEMRLAFGEKIPAYAFLGMHDNYEDIEVGLEDSKIDPSDKIGRYKDATRGFKYRGTPGVGVTKKQSSSTYSKPIDSSEKDTKENRARIANLRSDMREIGNALATSLDI